MLGWDRGDVISALSWLDGMSESFMSLLDNRPSTADRARPITAKSS